MSKLKENLIVIALMIAVVIGLLSFVGYGNIKQWLGEPITWDDYQDVQLHLLRIEKKYDDTQILQFVVSNNSGQWVGEVTFLVEIEGVTFELSSGGIGNGRTESEEKWVTTKDRFSSIQVDEAVYNKIAAGNVVALKKEFKPIYVKGENNQYLVRNDGLVKILLILGLSFGLGMLGFVEKFPIWLRILLKTCMLPALVLVIAILVLVAMAGSKGDSSGRQKEDAKKRYKHAADLKAAAEHHGNTHDAAKAQEAMDRAMADMLTADAPDSSDTRAAAARYKQAANLKAGAAIHGNTHDAAHAQATMDKAMADMISKK